MLVGFGFSFCLFQFVRKFCWNLEGFRVAAEVVFAFFGCGCLGTVANSFKASYAIEIYSGCFG